MSYSAKVDYYTILGVPRTATVEELKQAYRVKAKELHPDKNRGKDATAKFQQLQEAYAVLGSPERRQLYDDGNFTAAVDPTTEATDADYDPIPCDACGCISAQPRFVQYDRVISFMVASYRTRPAGVFCPSCASRKLFINSLITGAVGWLGIWGIAWSITSILRNLRGGVKSPGVNAYVLGRQAAYFYQQGRFDLARVLAKESLNFLKKSRTRDDDYDLGNSVSELAKTIQKQSGSSPKKLRSRWSGWSSPARSALAGFAISIAAWVFLFNISEGSSGPTQNPSPRAHPTDGNPTVRGVSNPARHSASSEDEYIDVPGAHGHTYRVRMSDYRRLKPIYDSIESRQQAISYRVTRVNSEHEELERRRNSLDSYSEHAVGAFNRDVDKWNLSNRQLRAESEALDREIDSYNSELERVGRRVR